MANIDNKIILEELLKRELARRSVLDFTKYTMPEFDPTWFHEKLYTILDFFAEGVIKKLMISCGPQNGKALKKSTDILTTKGWSTHGELKPGDYVYGPDGLPKKVLNNFGVHRRDTYRIEFVDGYSLYASSEHEWVVLVNGKKTIDGKRKRVRIEKKLNTETLKKMIDKGVERAIAISVTKPLQNDDIELPIDPYLLGAWLGDGSSVQGAFSCKKEKADHLSKMLGQPARDIGEGSYRIVVPGLTTLLRENALISNKHIPEVYFLSSENQRRRLLAGLMDTDGYSDKKGRCEFGQSKERLSFDVWVLLNSLGIKATLKEGFASCNNKTFPRFRIGFSPNKGEKIFFFERKQQRIDEKSLKDRVDKYKHFIKGITLNEKNDLVNCIQVEGGVYLVGNNLIPTHNSEASSRRLPAYLMGKNPNLKIALSSYNASFAQQFGMEIQRIMNDRPYHNIFPQTLIGNSPFLKKQNKDYKSTKGYFEILGHRGSLKAVGRGQGLTGSTVDIKIIDDLYKDASEANSSIIRESTIDWYNAVVLKRLHNNSQQLILFTRWHPQDLIGWLEERETVKLLTCWEDINYFKDNPDHWAKINFPTLKVGPPNELDPREEGEALWESKHSRTSKESERALDPEKFSCLEQGDPQPKTGLLFSNGFKTYIRRPDFKAVKNYTDVADQGKDYLCSICYGVGIDDYIYVLDVVYTQEPAEVTEQMTADMLRRAKIREADFEANSAGKGYARAVDRLLNKRVVINWHHQSGNKESRVLTNASTVANKILMPHGWVDKWPEFARDVLRFKRNFKSNKHDDCVDALVGIWEFSGLDDNDYDALYRK